MKQEIRDRIEELKDKCANPFDEHFDYVGARIKIEELVKLLYLFED